MSDKVTQQIEVMAAWKNGKKIESKLVGSRNWQAIADDPVWNWQQFDYRIAPVEDPYKKFKDALAEGRVVEINTQHGWVDNSPYTWSSPPDRYRIAKREVKYWNAIIESGLGGFKLSSGIFSTVEEASKKLARGVKVIRLATELPPIIIEVDD